MDYQDHHEHIWKQYVNWFTDEQPSTAIDKLKDKKDQGPMGISVQFLKFNKESMIPILLNFFNAILQTGVIPQEWKRSLLIPIAKKGSTTEITNCRGVVQSVIPKLFDKLLTEKLYAVFHQIIPSFQHGFTRKRDTVTNLLNIAQELHSSILNAKVDVIYVDFSKAFDKVDHRLMAAKLARLSMPFLAFKVVMIFIIRREYIIKINGEPHSESFMTRSAVPQGSHCGPLLFDLYTIDIRDCVLNTRTQLLQYADDVKLYKMITNNDDKFDL